MTTQPEAAKAIEAILMVAQEPVDPHLLAQVLEVAPPIVEELCTQLAAAYAADDRGFVLAKVAGGYRFQSHADLAPYVERFVLEGQSARLSAAALETLAIVAYKQPLSRAQVAAIRGVNVDGVMRTLLQRGYLIEVGRDHGPGQATLFGTSQEFLERLGLDRLEDLPPIADLFPDESVMEALERGLRADPVVAPGDLEAPQPSLLTPPVPDAATPGPDHGPSDVPRNEPVDATSGAEPVDEPVDPTGHEAVDLAAGGAALSAEEDPTVGDEPEVPAWALDPEPVDEDPAPAPPDAANGAADPTEPTGADQP